jgi:23S rRNA pseudouridine2604 synthase
MSFRQKLKYYLVHTHHFSGKEVTKLLSEGLVDYNGSPANGAEILKPEDIITLNNRILKAATNFRYYRFYKPAGLESTLNADLPDAITCFAGEAPGLAIAGRLDKASEGLLLISDDGKWIEEICHPKQKKTKTYEVELSPQPDQQFVAAFSKGVLLGDGYLTLPCGCRIISDNKVEISLTEGKNRQIRRMCHKLGYTVNSLKRIAIENWTLEGLEPLQYAHFKPHT